MSKENDIIICADDFIKLFDLPTGLMSIERKQCALILSDMLADLEDDYNFNDPKRKSFYRLVSQELKERIDNY